MTRPRLVLVVLVAAAGLAWLVERLVVTDTEAVTAVLERAAADATRGDWDAVADAVDDGFLEGGRDKAAFVAWAKRQWRAANLRSMTLAVRDVRVVGDQAAARVEATLLPYAFRVPGRVDLERRGDTWRIVRASADDPTLLHR